MSRKIIVTIAPTGGMAKKSQSEYLPTQPQEIADSVYKCYKAGASVAAIHARRPDDEATCNAEIYRDINTRVRERCDIIINNSTGGGIDGDLLIARPDGFYDVDFEHRLQGLEADAEMATFDGFTMGVVGGGREQVLWTLPSQCDIMAKRFQEKGIKPEWEVFNHANILQDMTRLIKAGYDRPPYYVNIVLNLHRGFQGGLPYSHDTLTSMVALLPPDCIWLVSGIAEAQLPATTQALLLGGHVRVGLEDNLNYDRGVRATNEQLVERQIRILRELGHEPASPGEARDMIGLKHR